jgi:TolB-like protein/Flp pilus assembly protein TadD
VADDKSIAVLPFDNRSELKSDEFFTDGIHDDLLTQISRIRDIKTLSRTSVMAYKDTTKNMVTIGEELGVNWLLEGGVQRGGQQIRINVQLIDATNDAHLWAETYTRELTAENIFRIQSEIVTLIADSLKAVISPEEKERLEMLPTNNLEALEAYFRGMEGYVIRTTTSIENSIDHFEEAISLDPDFALAHLKLGASFIDQITHLGFSRDEGVAKAEPYVLKALELDDTLSEAYRVLGVLRRYQGDRAAAEIAHQKAIELDPNNPQAYDAYEILVRGKTGPTPRKADLMRKAYEADPKDSLAKDRLAESYEALGQWDRALEIRESLAAEYPNSGAILLDLGWLYLEKLGRIDDAIITFRKQLAVDPAAPLANWGLSDAYLFFGDTERSIWWIDRYLKNEKDLVRQANMGAWKFRLQGDDEARERVVSKALLENPESGGLHYNVIGRGLLYSITDLYIASGQLEELRAHWQQAYPSLFKPRPQINWIDRWAAKDLARVLKATGEEEQANLLIGNVFALLNSVTADLWSIRLEAVLYAMKGYDQQTLDAVGRFFDAGGSPYELEWEDELKPILEHPEYQAMAEKRKAELAVQLNRINEMEANGELPPIPDLPAN